jgi:4-amino-4-deoxy-L-arabinose transferase-like glycosyltransferase
LGFEIVRSSSWYNKSNTLITSLWIVILAGASLLMNLRWDPIFQYLEADSGVYAYVGSSILNGQLPYRDVWEQKPPIGFYLNALALAMFGHSPWAIWWFNVIWIALTSVIFFLLVRKMMGTLTGCLASLFFLAGVMIPELFQGGNLMEVYGLLPQVLIIAAVYQFFSKQQERWIFIAGLLTAIALLTKQTTIALGLSTFLAVLIISLLRREFKQTLLRLFLFASGVITPIVLVSSYWILNGAFYDFLDAVLLHSLAYVGEKVSFLWSLKNTTLNILPKLYISRLYYVGAAAFILYLIKNYRWVLARLHRNSNTPPVDIHPVELSMLGVFIALPVEVAMASLGARNFGHYFLTLVPAGAAGVAYIIWNSIKAMRAIIDSRRTPSILSAGWLLLFLVSMMWLYNAFMAGIPDAMQLASINKIFSNQYDLSVVEKYILNTTKPNDRVLIWHIHVGTNFLTNTKAGARVLFPLNLFIPDEQGFGKLDSFIREFETNPPKLIIVQNPNSAGLPFVNVSLEDMCKTSCTDDVKNALKRPDVLARLAIFKGLFDRNYVLEEQFHEWYIYRYVKQQ